MNSRISPSLIDSLTNGPSDSKTKQVANMQNYIQELLGDTHHTFLQGSYRNDTAISDINDVDIVAVRISTYSGVYSPHGPFPSSVYWDSIFGEIEEKLRNQRLYTWTVTRGDKCIKVRGAFNADIIPAVKVDHDHLTDPIVVYSFNALTEKLNRPRLHYRNGVAKQQATKDKYKPTVRMFKNWTRNHFGENNKIVPSFKMESLVYGIVDENFSDDHGVNFLIAGTDILNKLTARTLSPLFIPSVCGGENIIDGWGLIAQNMFTTKLRESLSQGLAAYKADSISEADAKWRMAFNI